MVSIENPEAMIPSPGETFHGRDVFAPAAALLASGEAVLADLGPPVQPDQVRPLLLPLPSVEGLTVTGEAWWVDHFGNVQTNIGPDELAAVGVLPGSVVTLTIGATLKAFPGWVPIPMWAGGTADPCRLGGPDRGGGARGRADELLNLRQGVMVTMAGRGSTPTG